MQIDWTEVSNQIYSGCLTAAFTIIGGVVVLVLGQLISKFLIEPMQEQSKLIGEIANSVVFYGNVGSTGIETYYIDEFRKATGIQGPEKQIIVERYEQLIRQHWQKSEDASKTLREQASKLMGVTEAIPFYGLWTFLGRIPKRENVIKASSLLIGMSNSTSGGGRDNTDRRKEIAKLLNIRIIAERFGAD